MNKINYSFVRAFYEAMASDFDHFLGTIISSYKYVDGIHISFATRCVSHDMQNLIALFESCNSDESSPVALLTTMSKIGKAIETSFVTSQAFLIERVLFDDPYRDFFFARQGNTFSPVMFRGLFSLAFNRFGLPMEGLATANGDVALAFYMLRQLFLAFSKVEDLDFHLDEDAEVSEFISRISSCLPICGLDNRVATLARRLLRARVLRWSASVR